jgi:hypothetical protein
MAVVPYSARIKKNLHILTEEIVLPFMYAGTFGAVVLKLGAAAQSGASVASRVPQIFINWFATSE